MINRNEEFPTFPSSMEFRSSRPDQQGFMVEVQLNEAIAKGVTPFLQINKHGERFMNESIPGQQLENQIELQPDHTSYQVYDSDWGSQIP